MLNYASSITRSELARALGIGRTTVYRWERRGLIPAPDRISGNRSLFAPAAQMAAAALAEAAR